MTTVRKMSFLLPYSFFPEKECDQSADVLDRVGLGATAA